MEQSREAFVKDVIAKRRSMTELCREYGISRPTGYKWVRRYKEGYGFNDLSHAPIGSPANKTPDAIEEKIVELRQQYPMLGAAKLQRLMKNDGVDPLPCARTVNNVLNRNNLILPESSDAAKHYKRFEKAEPNVMWQMDFKGDYQTGDGIRCHPLSVVDDHSRFCLCADALTGETHELVQPCMERTMRKYGMPDEILCDNGNPWGSSHSTGVTAFEVWLMEHGIRVRHIPPRYPQAQGKVERFNGSFKKECLARASPESMERAMAQRQEYRWFYNNLRPHHALKLDVPAQHYSPSTKEFKEEVEPWIYEEGTMVRSVRGDGYVSVKGKQYFISNGLRKKRVELVECEHEDGLVNVLFREFVICQIDLKECNVMNRRITPMRRQP